MDRKAPRLGRNLLLLAGLAGVLGGVLRPPQPRPLAGFAEQIAEWRISSIALGVAATLLIIGTLLLARHFAAPHKGRVRDPLVLPLEHHPECRGAKASRLRV